MLKVKKKESWQLNSVIIKVKKKTFKLTKNVFHNNEGSSWYPHLIFSEIIYIVQKILIYMTSFLLKEENIGEHI